jgi:putative endonuclease
MALFRSSRTTGHTVEQQACAYLQRQGLRLVEQNYHCPAGELDLIMQHQDTLVFVEVRYRKSQDYGGALASVTPTKQRRISKTALHYLQKHKLFEKQSCRFDIVAVTPGNPQAFNFHWLQNAFA